MTGKLLVFDNYDSFTYNLVHYLEALTGNLPEVILNDAQNWEDALHADALLISPGPGLPEESGFLMEVLRAWSPKKPLLGICLGMQAMGQLAGERLLPLPRVVHGKPDAIQPLIYDPLFQGLPNPFSAGRYHSWGFFDMTTTTYLPTALGSDSCIMGMRHRQNPWWGVQFHPESIMTESGLHILHNWLTQAGIPSQMPKSFTPIA